ncbi:MAG: mitofilin family membrane protein [Silicimonas sp.]|nr:mitofilin family membrane protein [Silicimonas sp.]
MTEDESTLEGAILLDEDLEEDPDELLDLEDFPADSIASGAPDEAAEDDGRDLLDDIEDLPVEPEPAAAPVAPAPEPQKRSAMPLVLGGLLAGGIGFAAAYGVNGGFSGASTQIGEMELRLSENAETIAALNAQIETLAGSIPEVPDVSGLEAGLGALETTLGDVTAEMRAETATQVEAARAGLGELAGDLAALRERMSALELASGNAESAQADAAAEQLTAFRNELEAIVGAAETRLVAAEAEALALRSEAEAAARAETEEAERRAAIAAREAALSELRTAVDGGGTFVDLIAELGDVPADLAAHAETGVPTLVALQQEFAPAARTALSSTQVIPEDASTGARLTAFLRRQTNARSLAPKEGDDPDAILSRAEALLTQGKLGEALGEVTALPEEARAAMAGWITDAETRQAALLAVDSLSSNLN